MEFLEALSQRIEGLPLPLAMAVIALATFVSEDLACIGAALLAAAGRLPAFPAIFAAGFGIWVGDLLLYALGAAVGRPLVRRAPLRYFLDEEHLDLARDWFAHRGTAVLWIARLVPGTRLATYVAAGTLHAPFWRFAWITLLACLVWTPLLGGAAYFLGQRAIQLADDYRRWALWILAAVVIGLVALLQWLVPMFTWRGRRALVGRFRRWRHWEFWPPWLFYPPVIAHVLWLALRHRSLTLFTAVNPSMPAGGFIGESKTAILAGLGPGPRVVRSRLIPAALPLEARAKIVAEFQQSSGLSYPIVLKPDAGQRGSGVKVAREPRDVRAWLEVMRADGLVQEFVPGIEFGVFYYRFPREATGRVFSITHKVFPSVVGDGRSTLERLILLDPRAVAMADAYRRRLHGRLWEVPAAGERVTLVDIGNHCQGAVFLDGSAWVTPELERAIDELSRGYAGFYFGRYDVRANSLEDFRAGRFCAIELNGATSEATHIYDPKHSVLDAWAILRRQWRILFEIARQNREGGAPVATLGELLSELRRYRRGARSHPV